MCKKQYTCGIYGILNTVNGKIYVGQSIKIEKRWKQHIRELRKNTHINKYLQNSFNKHGEEAFKFIILEECARENLNEREVYWVSYYGGVEDEQHNFNIGMVGQQLPRKKEINQVVGLKMRGKRTGAWLENIRKANALNHQRWLNGEFEHHHWTEEEKKHLASFGLGKPRDPKIGEKISESLHKFFDGGGKPSREGSITPEYRKEILRQKSREYWQKVKNGEVVRNPLSEESRRKLSEAGKKAWSKTKRKD